MSAQKSVALASAGIIGILIATGLILMITGGYMPTAADHDGMTAWNPRTIDQIYEDFGEPGTNFGEYIWPTDVTTIMTSAFGEFRQTHLHAGIDISTRGLIGAPVLAARAGYIEQVGVSPFGYGKYVVMRHRDGYSTLYAHLDSFDERVEDRVYARQHELEQYSVTLTFDPDEFVFERGDIIARSGSTGSGPPHIHFEIRDTNNNPLNPKFSGGISVNDSMPPIFNRIAAIPISTDAFINDQIKPSVQTVTPIRPGEYVVNNPLRVSGTFGLAADVHDRNDDTWYRHGVYALEFIFDDSLLYTVRYDRLPLQHRRQIRMHYDDYLLTRGRGRFQKLFIEEGNILPLYDRLPHGSGKINSAAYPPGTYEYRIVAYDFAGNRSTAAGSVVVEDATDRKTNPETLRLEDKIHVPMDREKVGFEYELFRNMLLFSVRHHAESDSPALLVADNGTDSFPVNLYLNRHGRLEGRLRLRSSPIPAWDLYYVYGDTAYHTKIDIYSIHPGRSDKYTVADAGINLSFDYGSVYSPFYFTVSDETLEGERVYKFDTNGSVFDNGIRLVMAVPDTMEPFDRTVLMSRDNSKWNVIGSARDPGNRTLTTTLRHLPRNIKVAVDTTKPTVSNVLVDGNRNMRLRFRVSDDESGIDHSSLRIRLDDSTLIGRYDPDLSMVIHRAREAVQPGRYMLRISVNDRAGNGTVYEREVIIR